MNITISQKDINLFKSVTCESDQEARNYLMRYSNVDTAISHYFQALEQQAILKSPSPHAKMSNNLPSKPFISHFIRRPDSNTIPKVIKTLDFEEKPKSRDLMNIEKEENKEIERILKYKNDTSIPQTTKASSDAIKSLFVAKFKWKPGEEKNSNPKKSDDVPITMNLSK